VWGTDYDAVEDRHHYPQSVRQGGEFNLPLQPLPMLVDSTQRDLKTLYGLFEKKVKRFFRKFLATSSFFSSAPNFSP
jgi:hypothetical protein